MLFSFPYRVPVQADHGKQTNKQTNKQTCMSGSSGRTDNLSNLALFKNLLKIINFTRKKIQKCLSKFISQVLALTRELLFYNLWNVDVIIFYTHNFEQIHVNSVIRFWNITQTCMSGGSAKWSNLEILKKSATLLCTC